jgi:tetratricopeptide (TPR) repeat protein
VFPYHGGAAKVLRSNDLLGDDAARSYAIAWALVHLLVNRHPQQLAELQGRFLRGQDPKVAWREVFPQWDPATEQVGKALDKEIGGYLLAGKYNYRGVRLPEAAPIPERPMSAAEAHTIRLSLPWLDRGEKPDPARLKAEIEEALAHDPGHVAALERMAKDRTGDALALAERATAAHPEDARAWLFLARSTPDGERRSAALRKAVEMDGASADAANELAWTLLEAGRSGEALPLARRAVATEPWNEAIIDTLAGVLEDLEQCPEALALQRRAMDVLPEGTSAGARAAFVERRSRLEAACGRPPPAPAPAAAP